MDGRVMPYLLNAFYLALLAATLPFWLYKSITTGKYRVGLWQKLAGAPPPVNSDKPVIWFHAVSVGEVLLLRPLLEKFKADAPHFQLVLSVTTNSGMAVAESKYPWLPAFYAPLDFSWAVRRVYLGLDPKLVVLTELELWPNLLLEARRRGEPVAVVNARMSERSFRGYSRLGRLLHAPLAAIRWWGVQNDTYAARIRTLVANLDKPTIAITGSMKYEGAPTERDNPKTRELGRLFGLAETDVVFLAGSTMAPEEEMILEAFLRLRARHPRLRLVLVPRHPERFAEVGALAERTGLEVAHRSRLAAPRERSAPITLLDTVGELAAAWGLAEIGYVGGSLGCQRGGQSMIEPAGYGVAFAFGPETWNFQDTVDHLLALDAAVRIERAGDLEPVLDRWLADPAAAAAIGRRARQFVLEQQGSVAATYRGLLDLLPPDHDLAAANTIPLVPATRPDRRHLA